MRRCLELAEDGRGKVGNGALVGAVLVHENKEIAQGLHRGFGEVHAERDLLLKFKGNVPEEAILYVNLEPCCHHGKTPPCTDIILERGIKHVVFGMADPDSRVTGKGISVLREKGVDVIGPVARASCEYFNRGFVSVRTKGRPWVIIKKAQAKTGDIANRDGSPIKITSEEQDRWSHTSLRSRVDGIVVGVETVVRDNPKLDTRLAQRKSEGEERKYQPWRIILDRNLRVPLDAYILSSEESPRTTIITSPGQEGSEGHQVLVKRGARVCFVPLKDGKFDWSGLWQVLLTPEGDYHGITSILVEGGARTWKAFRDAGMVDEEVVLTGR